MVAHQIYAPSLELLPDDYAHSSLNSASRLHNHRLAHCVISHNDTTIILVGDIGLCQYHYVDAANLHCPDGMSNPVAQVGMDVEGPYG